MELESWSLRWHYGPIVKPTALANWWLRLSGRVLCRHVINTDQLRDVDLKSIRAWILDNVHDPYGNMHITLMMLDERYLVGGEFRFRRAEDAVAFRLRWC